MQLEKVFIRPLTVHPDDQRWGLYATAIGCTGPRTGDLSRAAQQLSAGQTLGDFHLAWISGGAGEFQSEGRATVSIDNSSLILVPPGYQHQYYPLSNSCWNEYWVNFNGDFARMLLASGAVKPHPVVQPASAAAVRRLFEQLMERLQAPHHAMAAHAVTQAALPAVQLVAADLFQLLALAAGPRGTGEQTAAVESSDTLVAEAVAIIWSEGRASITVEELTEEMLVARRTLERAFRKTLAHGIHDEILLCRLDRTTRLLANRSLSIEQVAVESGFGNVRSLRRAFVAARGMSPQAYRNLILSDPKAA